MSFFKKSDVNIKNTSSSTDNKVELKYSSTSDYLKISYNLYDTINSNTVYNSGIIVYAVLGNGSKKIVAVTDKLAGVLSIHPTFINSELIFSMDIKYLGNDDKTYEIKNDYLLNQSKDKEHHPFKAELVLSDLSALGDSSKSLAIRVKHLEAKVKELLDRIRILESK